MESNSNIYQVLQMFISIMSLLGTLAGWGFILWKGGMLIGSISEKIQGLSKEQESTCKRLDKLEDRVNAIIAEG